MLFQHSLAQSRVIPSLGIVLLAGIFLQPTAARAQAVGYSHPGAGHLFLLELFGDSSPIDPRLVGSNGLMTSAMAEGPANSLYAVRFGEMAELWTLDRESAAATLVGNMGFSFSFLNDLAIDDGGDLWLVEEGTLYSVNPATGQATQVSGSSTELLTLGNWEGTLYGIAGDVSTGTFSLVAVDRTTGQITTVTELSGIEVGSPFVFPLIGLNEMDFDDRGGLWVLVERGSGSIDPPIIVTEIYYFADPFSGSATSHAEIDSQLPWNSLVVTGSPQTTACVSTTTAPCLTGSRFQVQVDWHTAEAGGVGRVATTSEDSAVLYFFSPDNWEMLVKVLDGCGTNDHFWVFYAATTDVGFTLTVTDTDSGAERTYTNALGHPADAVTDTSAFATCP